MKKEFRTEMVRKQLALARAFGAIIIANFIVWMPMVLFVILSLILPTDTIPIGYFIFSYITFASRSLLHPLIEGCLIPDIKDMLKIVIGVNFCKRVVKKGQEGD